MSQETWPKIITIICCVAMIGMNTIMLSSFYNSLAKKNRGPKIQQHSKAKFSSALYRDFLPLTKVVFTQGYPNPTNYVPLTT